MPRFTGTRLPIRTRARAWSPLASLPGLIAYGDGTTSRFQDADRVTAAVAATDPVYWSGALRASGADVSRPTLVAGPASGRLALAWDGTNSWPLFQVEAPWFSGKKLTLFSVFKFAAQPAGVSRVIGRGEFSGNGTCICVGTDGKPLYRLTTGGTVSTATAADQTGNWVVAALSYDAVTARFKVRGQSMVSDATDGGALAFHASDTAAWIGGSTPSGASFAFYDAKTILLWGVTTDVFASDAALTGFVNNLAAYAGVP